MASLKECRAKARKLGLTIFTIPEKSKLREKYRYRLNHFYLKNVEELTKEISRAARAQKKTEMVRKLDGHRPKYGFKTVPRKRRKAAD